MSQAQRDSLNGSGPAGPRHGVVDRGLLGRVEWAGVRMILLLSVHERDRRSQESAARIRMGDDRSARGRVCLPAQLRRMRILSARIIRTLKRARRASFPPSTTKIRTVPTQTNLPPLLTVPSSLSLPLLTSNIMQWSANAHFHPKDPWWTDNSRLCPPIR